MTAKKTPAPSTILRIEHVARHFLDGGDRWTIRLWRRHGTDGAHLGVRLPLAACPTEAAATLLVDAMRAYQEASVAAGLGDPLGDLAAVYAALDRSPEMAVLAGKQKE